MPSLSRPKPHVLLVEEDDEVRDVYKELLVFHGYIVSAARSGLEALDLAKQAPDAVFSSLVFRDLSGFELCRRLRALPQTANSLIVALTGYSEKGIEAATKAAGFDAYHLKPVSFQDLLGLLDRIPLNARLVFSA